MLSHELWSVPLGLAYALVLVIVILLVYSRYVATRPHLYYKDSPTNRYVLKHCERLTGKFTPTFWAPNGHLQTILVLIFPIRKASFTREILEMKDGGIVALDWATESTGLHQSSPLLILLPGLAAVAKDLTPACKEGIKRRFRCVVLNKRGHGGSQLKTPKLQSFADPSDLREVVENLTRRYPDAKLTAFGSSVGGAVLSVYLGKFGKSTLLSAAVADSHGLTAKRFYELERSQLPFVYRTSLLNGQKEILRAHAEVLREVIDVQAALNADSMREYEDVVYRKMYGFKDLDEYWNHNDPFHIFGKISTPTLITRSKDDPLFVHTTGIPVEVFKANPNTILALTERGGHCGFWEGVWPESWSSKVALDYIEAVLELESTNDKS